MSSVWRNKKWICSILICFQDLEKCWRVWFYQRVSSPESWRKHAERKDGISWKSHEQVALETWLQQQFWWIPPSKGITHSAEWPWPCQPRLAWVIPFFKFSQSCVHAASAPYSNVPFSLWWVRVAKGAQACLVISSQPGLAGCRLLIFKNAVLLGLCRAKYIFRGPT